MRRRSAEVTWKKADGDRLPDRVSEGAALVLDLGRRGVLEEVGRRIRIRREGGYCGFDVGLFLLLYFTGETRTGIRKFWDVIRPHSRRLAALADRKRIPSPASMSRALDAAEPELVRPAAEWLLSLGAGIDAVLRHPSVQTYDSRGNGWHVFDFDPTVSVARQRALPEGEDLPAARRRSSAMAAGYGGRKRGDVQFRRGTLQHAGSSAWLQVMLGPGNGDGRAELEGALQVVVRTCERLGHPRERALLRTDGAFGGVPYLAACRAQGVPFLTRLNRLDLLDQPEVARIIREGRWHMVPDSLSGPRRSALDLGIVTVPPGADTRRADGTAYEPVATRVVLSRYPRTEKAEHGRVLDGWQYELFAVDVPPDVLPAADVVAAYFGRGGQENRFAQEDREAGLDRIFSYHLPGQELAVAGGLWVWNLRLVRGYALELPPDVRPVQQAYVDELDLRRVAVASNVAEVSPAGMCSAQASCEPGAACSVEEPRDEAAGENPAGPADAQTLEATPEESSVMPAVVAPRHTNPIVDVLRLIDWDQALRNRVGWSWDPDTGHLRCPDGRLLALTTVRKREHASGRTGIIFCRPAGGCDPCELRSACLRSTGPSRTPKHAEVSVPSPIAARLLDLLRARRHPKQDVSDHRPDDAEAVLAPEKPAVRRTARSRAPYSFTPLPPALPLFAVLPSLFLPAVARHLLRAAASRLTFTVAVHDPEPAPRLALIAGSIADKQHRRKTWRQNVERNALDPAARVLVEITGDNTLREMLGVGAERAAG
jgi:hypothetical protein